MKRLLFTFLLSPFLSTAQNNLPRLEQDTLYTSSGYKIYKGQILHLASGTSEAGYFRFIKFHSNLGRTDTYSLQNSTILVSKLKNYKNSGDDHSIRIAGTVTYKDGKQAETDIIMNFENAITGAPGLPGELTVPEEFKSNPVQTPATEIKKLTAEDETKKQNIPGDIKNILIADELKKLFDLYKAGALTKDEYDLQKKKLLDRQ